jgi:hypothetical protein
MKGRGTEAEANKSAASDACKLVAVLDSAMKNLAPTLSASISGIRLLYKQKMETKQDAKSEENNKTKGRWPLSQFAPFEACHKRQ